MKTKYRALGAAAALAAVGAMTVPATHAQDYNKPPKPITIKMKQKGKKFFFSGPNSVDAGAKITFVNTTNPKKAGPHTATVLDPALVPTSKADLKDCENLKGVCGDIAKAHKVEFVSEQEVIVNAPVVDVGKKGWDKAFGKKGDTWYTEKKNEEHTRKLALKSGSITFFCVVHPTMVKTLKINK